MEGPAGVEAGGRGWPVRTGTVRRTVWPGAVKDGRDAGGGSGRSAGRSGHVGGKRESVGGQQ